MLVIAAIVHTSALWGLVALARGEAPWWSLYWDTAGEDNLARTLEASARVLSHQHDSGAAAPLGTRSTTSKGADGKLARPA